MHAMRRSLVRAHCRTLSISASRLLDTGVCIGTLASIMEKYQQKAIHDGEMMSDREIRSAICYLDPESTGCVSDFAIIAISLLAIAALVCAVWLLFRLCGL
jgi:hypothetical protein